MPDGAPRDQPLECAVAQPLECAIAQPYLDALAHHVWIASPHDGRASFFNRSWQRYTGLSRAEAVQGGGVCTIHPDDRPRFEAGWRSALDASEPLDLELRVRGVDGRYRWFDVHAEPVRDPGGEITAWIGTQTDIDDRKRFEDAAHTVAHDLRAPLNAIAVAAASGQRTDARWAFERITDGVHRMNALIQGVLCSRRSTAAHLEPAPLEPAPNDLGAAIQAALEDLEPEILARGVRVTLPERWPSVRCARAELYQVALNLLGNAIRFAGREHANPSVKVCCEKIGAHIVLRVSDNGPGIAAKHHKRIFERGHTLDPERSNTGLGLEIVQRILERHGGTVEIESAPSWGTCFVVHFRCEERI